MLFENLCDFDHMLLHWNGNTDDFRMRMEF